MCFDVLLKRFLIIAFLRNNIHFLQYNAWRDVKTTYDIIIRTIRSCYSAKFYVHLHMHVHLVSRRRVICIYINVVFITLLNSLSFKEDTHNEIHVLIPDFKFLVWNSEITAL